MGSITLAYLSPGVSHNAFIAKLADITIMDFIGRWMPVTVGATLASIVLMVIVCVVYRDFRREGFLRLTALRASSPDLPENPTFSLPLLPLLPVVILVCASIWRQLKMSVATAMLIALSMLSPSLVPARQK